MSLKGKRQAVLLPASPVAESTQKQVPFQLPHAPWGAPCFFPSSEVACGSHTCSQVPGLIWKFTPTSEGSTQGAPACGLVPITHLECGQYSLCRAVQVP